MSFADRLLDDDLFVGRNADEEPPAPRTVVTLLNQLHLLDDSHQDQIDGIRSWLAGHEPTDRLVESIRSSSYAQALTA